MDIFDDKDYQHFCSQAAHCAQKAQSHTDSIGHSCMPDVYLVDVATKYKKREAEWDAKAKARYAEFNRRTI